MGRKATGTVGDLLHGWQTLSAWQGEQHPGRRKWNLLVDKLNRIAESVVTDPASVAELRQIAANDPNHLVRLYARQWVTPYVPRPDSSTDLTRWMNHPLIGIAGVPMQPRVGFALVPAESPDDPDTDLPEVNRTWLRGAPLAAAGERWPRRADDVPLAHLVQAQLGNEPLLEDRYPHFPSTGILQFFHDLETSGHDPGDETAAAWQVRLLAEPAAQLLQRPEDLGDDAFGNRWPAEVQPVWTFPASADLDLDDPATERLDVANQRVRETLHTQWGSLEDTSQALEYPLMLGHGPEPARHVAEILRQVRPPRSADDHHILLLTVPGNGPFDAWLGDEGNLEFWIRDSDIHHNAFEYVWALLR